MIRVRLAALAAALVLPAACGQAPAGPTSQPPPVIEASEAFLVAPAEGREVSSGGVVLKTVNGSARLVAARADVAERVELHTMAMQDGMMRMRQVDGFEVTPDAPRELRRGGDHLMFFGLRDGLAPGDAAELFLDFEIDGSETITLNVEAEVRSLDAQ